MFIELVDQLRCIRPHDDSWLVASAERMDGRSIVEGTLGCPLCRAQYAVRDGVGYFGAAPGTVVDVDDAAAAPGAAPDDEEVMRAAALLGLGEPGGFVLLCDEWASFARPLGSVVEVHTVLLNPAEPVASRAGTSVLRAPVGTLPLAAGALRAAALGRDSGSPGLAERTALALRTRGRLVGSVHTPVPAVVTELARDERHWVAERAEVASAPVSLGIARRSR